MIFKAGFHFIRRHLIAVVVIIHVISQIFRINFGVVASIAHDK